MRFWMYYFVDVGFGVECDEVVVFWFFVSEKLLELCVL